MALILYLNNASSHLVWISIKEKEKLLSQTHNILIGNLCAANLISAVFIKSISVIYHGYAVATGQWDFRMAFCTVYTGKWKPEYLVFPKSLFFTIFYLTIINFFFSDLSFHVGSLPLHDHGTVLGYFVGQSRKDLSCLEGLPPRQGLDWSLFHHIIMLVTAQMIERAL